MNFVFILYKPAVPGNVGSAARALKTMGFRELRLIDPCDHLAEEAKMMAHGSHEILEQAKVFIDFNTAIADLDFVIGTTAKKRTAKEDYLTPKEAIKILHIKQESLKKVGILFGTEESGLPNEILLECDLASTIPLKSPYPSINLGQSVMLYAYEFSDLEIEMKEGEEINAHSYAELKKRIILLMDKLDIKDNIALYHRILERLSQINSEDINLLHSISSRLDEKI
ncbi:MAG: tRNA/rRNA methyltransferase [Bacteroidales bacterium]|nr:tRNA/rRNA methyltransferase [Bacteroidales bacterium]MCF8391791.1 tRNA/rRNA methyltransferase [Bacteroidales bacterium]